MFLLLHIPTKARALMASTAMTILLLCVLSTAHLHTTYNTSKHIYEHIIIIQTYIHTFVHIYVRIHTYMYLSIFSIYLSIYLSIYICNTHTHTHTMYAHTYTQLYLQDLIFIENLSGYAVIHYTYVTQFAKTRNNPANQYFQYKALQNLHFMRKLSVLIEAITELW